MPSARVDAEKQLKDAVGNKHRAQCGWDVHVTIDKKLVKKNNSKSKVVVVREGKDYMPCMG